MRTLLTIILLYIATANAQEPYILVLGTAQDGGYPHIGCTKQCCTHAWEDNRKTLVTSLALVNPDTKKWWLFEATPDIKEQLQLFAEHTNRQYTYLPDGIFITHAHIGHYTGLMQLGREALGAKGVKVYAMPRMSDFLKNNGPWSQLVALKNIDVSETNSNSITGLANGISVQAFTVPHRDEYSETAGFKIYTPEKTYLFIPDINKWNIWKKNIVNEVNAVDIALLDATFYDSTELPGRNMSEIPHPFIQETMQLFNNEDKKTKGRVYFIHMNHTNPLLWNNIKRRNTRDAGYNIAVQGSTL